jgi:PAS domain S-box-containing protein
VALEKSIDRNLDSLNAIKGLFSSSPNVTRARFHTFVNSILSESDGIYSLRWAPRVADAERRHYETSAFRDGLRKYRISELNGQRQMTVAAKRAEYFPIYFTEPRGNSDPILGLDLIARPGPRALLEKARDTGQSVASARFKLLDDSGGQFSFVVWQPIYRFATPQYTVQERRKNLFGYAIGVYRFGDMVDAAMRGINLKGIELSLSDDSAPRGKEALYSDVTGKSNPFPPFTRTLQVADRTWTVKFYPTSQYIAMHKTPPDAWLILPAGILFSLLIALYVFSMKRHSLEIERSKDTIATVLNSIDSAIAIINCDDRTLLACNAAFLKVPGSGEQSVTGRRCEEITGKKNWPCNRACDLCPVTQTMRTGESAGQESTLTDPAGIQRHIEMKAYPVKNDAGKAVQVVQVAQDVTERRRAEQSRLKEQEVRRISAERQVVETQLRMLQAQVEPHFLFNTLANIISIIEKDPKLAQEMLRHLTKTLRHALLRSREEVSTLAQEAELLENYLSIFKVRMGLRLDYSVNIPQEIMMLPFPPMLLQPLVENALKHGIEPKIEGGSITIKAEKSGGLLRISVIDTGLGFSDPADSDGMGLENVRARLRALYKDEARLILEDNVPSGLSATIEVPL